MSAILTEPWRYADGVVTTPEGNVVAFVPRIFVGVKADESVEQSQAVGRAVACVPAMLMALTAIAELPKPGQLMMPADLGFAVQTARAALIAAVEGRSWER